MNSRVGDTLHLSRQEFKSICICTAGFVATPLLLFTSYNFLPTGLATTIHYVYPVLVLLGCLAFLKERLNSRKIISCALCMVGILCFYTPSGEISILGILIAIASGAANAFYTVFVSASGLLLLPTFKLAGWLNAISILPVVLVVPAMGGLVLSTSISGWEALFLLCTLSGTASIAYMLGTKFVGPQSISLLSTFEPLTSVVLGTIVLHETITRQSGWGIVCILLAVCLVSTTKDP